MHTCARCGRTDQSTSIGQSVIVEPAGWSGVTITGKPIRNLRLCSTCTPAVTAFATDYGLILADRLQVVGLPGLCHWKQNRDGVADQEAHAAFHYDSPCPYEVVAAVLRGEPDPREAAA